jgi:ABC-type glycerol-3-phosphate transport system substrate-binding protein
MRTSLQCAALSAAALLLAGCASLYAGSAPTTTPSANSGAETGAPAPTEEPGTAISLTLWLPPSFDPAGGSLAAGLLQSRLDEFSEQHPQILVVTRVKDETGPGGLLESLSSAQNAAPLALPDVALLSGSLLPMAAESGVIYAQQAFGEDLDSGDWYPFASRMSTIDGEAYGLPFAADALVTAHRSTAISQVPANWVRLMDTRIAFGFAAADSQARFTLLQLLSLAGDEGSDEFELSEASLIEVFDFLATGQARGVFPFWLTQYQSNEQTWQAFTEGRLPMVSTWTSQLFTNRQSEISGAPIPTQNGQPFTLVRGWAFAITTADAERAKLAVELVEFLTTPEFMAQYCAVAGLLPPRPSSLAAWTPDANQALASQIVTGAVPLPDQDTLERWGAALTPAVVALLKQEATPAEALDSVRAALAAQ